MSTSVFIRGEDYAVRSRLLDDDLAIWINTSEATIALTLTVPQIDQLIATAQAARALILAQAVTA
ncbi:hypothetical protein [Lysobacter sp. ESA13C]|uniref:hypothetical protein n=1 Tax=Lysobacter sp. ESA13C TaxID=2862676 RepID=UPI001CBE4BF6|nr:hypothetical protein [Lysobacter sp. ESA13C]